MPSENAHQKKPKAKKERGPSPDQKGYSTSEAILALKDGLIEEIQAGREQEPRADSAPNWIEYATLLFVFLTTIGIGFQDLILHSSDETFKATLLAQKKSSEQQLRAYVGITQRGIENFGMPNQVLKTMRKNYGATPAYDLIMDPVHIDVFQNTAQFPPAFCSPSPPSPINTLTLFPSQELRFEIRGQLLSKQQIERVRSAGDYRLIYWGTIHYKDAFGDARCTRYCWSFKGENMAEGDNDYCAQHNDAY